MIEMDSLDMLKSKIKYITDNIFGVSLIMIGVLFIGLGLNFGIFTPIFWGLEILGSVWFLAGMLSLNTIRILKTLDYYKNKDESRNDPKSE